MISLDPGAPDGGACWAKWDDKKQLVACGEWPCHEIDVNEDLVIEDQVILMNPFIRKGKRIRIDPKHIIVLAHRAGAAAAVFGYPEDESRVRWVKPRSWKGGTHKPELAKDWASYVIHRLVVQALSARELAVYTVALNEFAPGSRHNLADGVGIGLWANGRLRCES